MDHNPETTIEQLIQEQDPEKLQALARSLHPADIAAALEQMDPDRRVVVFACLDDEMAAETLSELDVDLQQSIISVIPISRTSEIVEEMWADEAADLLSELPEKHADAILSAMESEDAADLRELLDYEGDTAGGQMTTEFIAVPESLTAGETIQRLRELAPEAETIYHLFVIDDDDRLTGVVSLRSLIIHDPAARLADIMSRDVISVPADADQEVAADLIARYNLVAVPVIDEERRPIGIITVDDAVDVLDEEAAEDIYELGGVPETDSEEQDLLTLVRGRLPRLAGTLAVGLAAAIALRPLLLAAGRTPNPDSGINYGWVIAGFLPTMLTLSWLFETQARASLMARLARSRDRMWSGLSGEISAGVILSLACAVVCAAAVAALHPGPQAVIATSASLAVGLLVTSLASYLIPRLVLPIQEDPRSAAAAITAWLPQHRIPGFPGAAPTDPPIHRSPDPPSRIPSGATIAAHGAGVLAYLGTALGLGRLW